MSLKKGIKELGDDNNIQLRDEDITEIINFINILSDFIAKRSYHLMTHCQRKVMILRDIKNATRIEIQGKLSSKIVKFGNRIVTKYFIIKKGYSFEFLNQLFNYELLCPAKLLRELGIKLPLMFFRNKLKITDYYRVTNETTIFLICLNQYFINYILDNFKYQKSKTESKVTIKDVIDNIFLFSKQFE